MTGLCDTQNPDGAVEQAARALRNLAHRCTCIQYLALDHIKGQVAIVFLFLACEFTISQRKALTFSKADRTLAVEQ